MKKKKALTGLALTGILGLGAIGGSLAYLTDTDTAVNEFAAGKVDVAIEGEDWSDTLVPGKTYDLTRNVVLKEGSESAFIRVKTTIKKGNVLLKMMKEHVDPKVNLDMKMVLGGAPIGDSQHFVTIDNHKYRWLSRGSQGEASDPDDLVIYYTLQVSDTANSALFSRIPAPATEGKDRNVGSVFGKFTVPTEWDNAEIAALDGLKIEQEVQAIQAAGTEGYNGNFSDTTAWNNWKNQRG